MQRLHQFCMILNDNIRSKALYALVQLVMIMANNSSFYATVLGHCIEDTYFPHKNIHHWMWYSANGYTRMAISNILMSWYWHSYITSYRVFSGANLGNTDHQQLTSCLRIRLKVERQGKGKLHFDVCHLRDPQIAVKYSCSIINKFSIIAEEDCDKLSHVKR